VNYLVEFILVFRPEQSCRWIACTYVFRSKVFLQAERCCIWINQRVLSVQIRAWLFWQFGSHGKLEVKIGSRLKVSTGGVLSHTFGPICIWNMIQIFDFFERLLETSVRIVFLGFSYLIDKGGNGRLCVKFLVEELIVQLWAKLLSFLDFCGRSGISETEIVV
jgi:hypothetical protein